MNIQKLALLTCFLLVALASCSQAAGSVPPKTSPSKSASVPSYAGPVIATAPALPNFTEPDPATYVMAMKPVREYFYYRKQAVIRGSMQTLWDHYPALKQGEDIPKGINKEAFFVENMQGLKPFDGNISPEHYERIKVHRSDRQMQILAHGMELYLYRDPDGQFDDSGGEFKIILFLTLQDSQKWALYKTQDISGP